uniref:Bifunctional 4-hydroxy-2-oxoglutarate aldolase/2-dehydro-3-deoxy-phosphogluconate aldolase n=1 Tax=candidate division WOR-3 bacterium TaxID=2052148 RepID=A0A7V3KPP3_UNCW3
MKKLELIQKIGKERLITVFRGTGVEEATLTSEVLLKAGVKFIEVTINTPNGFFVLESLIKKFGGQGHFGAGTVLDSESAIQSFRHGAEFLVTPTMNPDVIRAANRYGKPCIIGALTPTEILNAYLLGADLVKVFPASVVGPKYIKAVLGPLNHIPLVPTGGVSLTNVREFIDAGAYAVGVGGELIDKKAIKEGNFQKIETDAKKFLDLLKGPQE